ncbi:MAG: PD40 domain-containing protein, partial [Thermoplasmata archaeon]|nr:PD40 domain-containing protein [Thermoplasmata archaeon]
MSSKKPITFKDLMAVDRVSYPTVHPGGRYVAYVTTRHSPEENRLASIIRMVDLETGEDKILTPGHEDHRNLAWSPDGKTLAFVSNRGGGEQIWLLPFEGGEARHITEGEGDVGKLVWSPDGGLIAFSRSVVVSPHWDGKRKKGERSLHGKVYGLVNPLS